MAEGSRKGGQDKAPAPAPTEAEDGKDVGCGDGEAPLIPPDAKVKIIHFGKELKGKQRVKETSVKEGSIVQAFIILKDSTN